MLIHCPECGHQVSDKALSCPACGYPMKPQAARRNRSKRRLPNGFGSITYLKGKRLRKPYLARVTVGKTDTGKPITRNLKPEAYYKTYNEAYAALIEFNRNPYTFDKDLTVYEALRLFMDYFGSEDHTDNYKNAMERAHKRCEPLYKMKLREIKPRHLKAVIETVKSPNEKTTLKQFWNRAFDYAIEYELADHNYARDFNLDDKIVKETAAKNPHQTFTDEEMNAFWDNKQDEVVRLILIQCYMGWRPNELCLIKKEDVNLDDWYIKSGSKTDAGRDRIVPVHTKIRELVKSAVDEMTDDTFSIDNKPIDYQRYYHYFRKVVKRLGLDKSHRPHDPRKQFVTMAKRNKVDEYVIKILVGHAIPDITESIYTDRDLEWLRSEIEKI